MHKQDFKLKPSKTYLVISGLVFILGSAALFFTAIPWWIKILLLIIFAIYGWYNLKAQGLLRGRDSVIGLRLLENGEWQITTPTQEYNTELSGDSTITHLVSVLRFKTIDAKNVLSSVVFQDSLPIDDYRRLLVLLRMC